MIVEAVAMGLSGRSGRSELEIRRVVEDEIRVPDFALPVYEAHLDDEARVWLAVHSTPEAATWIRLGSGLEPEARLTVPVDEEVLAIAYGNVITRWKDKWDVPEVRVYRILEQGER